MVLARWRARRALTTRSSPTDISDHADPRLTREVDALREPLGALESLGDPIWHHRWQGELQLMGIDARDRAVGDVRQRIVRTVHEVALQHMARRGRRCVVVVLCDPKDGEGLAGWHARLQDDQGEVGSDWKHVRGRVAVAVCDVQGAKQVFGGDAEVRRTLSEAGWSA